MSGVTEVKPLISQSSSSSKLPDFKKSVKLKYVKLGYHYLITHGMYLFLSPVVFLAAQLSTFSLQDVYVLWDHLRFPVPLSLEVIQSRLENSYYRRLAALKHDVEVLIENAETYLGRNKDNATKIRRLSDWFTRTLSSL